jgi:NRPS condensation-like uncharacterized protein
MPESTQPSTTGQSKQNRKLGGMEYLFRTTMAVIAVKMKGPVNPEALNNAINRIMAENHILACRIIKKGSHYFFQHNPDYQNILAEKNIASEAEESRIIETILQQDFNSGNQVFACTLLSYPDQAHFSLLVTYNHAISDGGSLHYFVSSLFEAYTASLNKDPEKKSIITTRPMEEYIHYKKTFQDFRKFIGREFAIRMQKRAVFPFHDTAPKNQRATRSMYRSISAELTRKITRASRKARTTPHGAYMAAILFAMAKHIPDNKLPFTMANNVNMRPQNNIPDNRIGVYISILQHQIPLHQDVEFWDLAKTSRKNLSKDAKCNMPTMAVALYYPVSKLIPRKMEEKTANGPDMGRVNNLCVASLGRMDIGGEFGGVTVENVISHVAIHEVGPNFGLIFMDYQGRLRFNLQYVSPLTTENEAKSIMDDFLKLLEQCVEENKFWPLKQ